MKKTGITLTEAARNVADCINRAYYQNVAFVLLKNGETVRSACAGQREALCRPLFGRGSGLGLFFCVPAHGFRSMRQRRVSLSWSPALGLASEMAETFTS